MYTLGSGLEFYTHTSICKHNIDPFLPHPPFLSAFSCISHCWLLAPPPPSNQHKNEAHPSCTSHCWLLAPYPHPSFTQTQKRSTPLVHLLLLVTCPPPPPHLDTKKEAQPLMHLPLLVTCPPFTHTQKKKHNPSCISHCWLLAPPPPPPRHKKKHNPHASPTVGYLHPPHPPHHTDTEKRSTALMHLPLLVTCPLPHSPHHTDTHKKAQPLTSASRALAESSLLVSRSSACWASLRAVLALVTAPSQLSPPQRPHPPPPHSASQGAPGAPHTCRHKYVGEINRKTQLQNEKLKKQNKKVTTGMWSCTAKWNEWMLVKLKEKKTQDKVV